MNEIEPTGSDRNWSRDRLVGGFLNMRHRHPEEIKNGIGGFAWTNSGACSEYIFMISIQVNHMIDMYNHILSLKRYEAV